MNYKYDPLNLVDLQTLKNIKDCEDIVHTAPFQKHRPTCPTCWNVGVSSGVDLRTNKVRSPLSELPGSNFDFQKAVLDTRKLLVLPPGYANLV